MNEKKIQQMKMTKICLQLQDFDFIPKTYVEISDDGNLEIYLQMFLRCRNIGEPVFQCFESGLNVYQSIHVANALTACLENAQMFFFNLLIYIYDFKYFSTWKKYIVAHSKMHAISHQIK